MPDHRYLTAADQLKEQADAFIKDAEENGVEADPENVPGVKVTVEQLTQRQLDSDDPALDMDGDGTKETSFKQAIPNQSLKKNELLEAQVLCHCACC